MELVGVKDMCCGYCYECIENNDVECLECEVCGFTGCEWCFSCKYRCPDCQKLPWHKYIVRREILT